MKTETYQIWSKAEHSYPQAFGFIPKISKCILEKVGEWNENFSI